MSAPSPLSENPVYACVLSSVYVRYFVVVNPSVCRLSVTFVHPTQATEIFGNVSTPFGSLAFH